MKPFKTEIKNRLVILGAFIVGILIASYLKTYNYGIKYMTLQEKKRLEVTIELAENDINKLKHKKKFYDKLLNEYVENKDIATIIDEELKNLKTTTGIIPVEGNGIVVSIEDSNKDIKEGENPNDFIVHDIDMLRIINDLKKAGAKAISINNERLYTNTSIQCNGPTIKVNNKTFGQPFIIKAVGNQESLKASIISPNSYSDLLKSAYGIKIELEENEDLIINP